MAPPEIRRLTLRLTTTALGLALLASCAAAPPPAPQRYEPPDERFVFFTAGKADVLADGLFSIGYVNALLDADPAVEVLVVGHADPHGRPDQNRELSFKRARAVRKVLVDHGIKAQRVRIAAPKEQSESTLTQLSRRADLYVFDPQRMQAEKRVGYPLDVKAE